MWAAILSLEVSGETDFFKSGAGSMDVTRLVEEVKEKAAGLELQPEDVYQAPSFADFIYTVISKKRAGGSGGPVVVQYDAVRFHHFNRASPAALELRRL